MMRQVELDRVPTVSLPEAAELLGVHYMTAYRYVRTGVLPGQRAGAQWRVPVAAVDELARRRREPSGRPPQGRGQGRAGRVGRLGARLVAGDEGGAWQLVEGALGAGASADAVLLDLVSPAMRQVGERWEAGVLTVGDEHRASAVAMRLVGRLGPLARHRGVGRGTVVVGAPPGERHQLPVAIAADVLRARGFDVIDLGSDVPAATWAAPALEPRVVAVAMGVSGPGHDRAIRAVLRSVSAVAPALPRLAGGAGLDPDHARDLGAMWSGWDGEALARAVLDVSA